MPESSVHGHQQVFLANVPNPWPFGIPSMGSVVAVTGFGQAVGMPLIVVKDHQDQRAVIPADAPDGVFFWIIIAIDTARAHDFSELVTTNNVPCTVLPLCEAA